MKPRESTIERIHKTLVEIRNHLYQNPKINFKTYTRSNHVDVCLSTVIKNVGFVVRIDYGEYKWNATPPDIKMAQTVHNLLKDYRKIKKQKRIAKTKITLKQPEFNLQTVAHDGLSETAIRALDRMYESLPDMRQELRSLQVRLMDIEGRLNGKPKRKFRFHFPIKFQKIITKE